MPESSDPYTYPGTNVLRNLPDIRDPVELAKFEANTTWAGEFRTVNISKGGHLFGAAAFIEPALHDLLRKLAAERNLQGVDYLTEASIRSSRTGDSSGMSALIELCMQLTGT